MPTTVTKTIAATSSPTVPDYTSLAAWIAACPANLVTADQIWDGQCLDQGALSTVNMSGITTDATRYVVLECAAGAGFGQKAGVRTTALAYNTASGVAVQSTGGSGYVVRADSNFTRVIGLQVKATSYSTVVLMNGSGCTVRGVIASGPVAGAGVIVDATAPHNCLWVNCLVQSGTTNGTACHIAGTLEYCTIVNTAGAGTSIAVHSDYNQAVVKNCAVFGFNSFSDSTPAAGSDYNATDLASAITGTHNQTSLTFSSQFVSTTTDFRAKAGNGLQHGLYDSTNAPLDISYFTRDATNPTIGAWETTPATASFTVSPLTIPEGHSGNITLTITGSGTAFNTGSSVVSVTNSVTGTTAVTKHTFTASSTTAATLTVSTGSGVGTYHLTIDAVVNSGALSTATPTVAVSPTSGLVSGTTGITLTGTNTVWSQETAASLFTFSGVAGTSIGSIAVSSDTAATATMTTGSTTGTGTITDAPTGDTCTFAVNAVTGSITLTKPVNFQTYQRNGSNQATITVTGTYTGGPAAKNMECSLAGSAFTALSTVPAAGAISGTVTFTVTPNTSNVQGDFVIRFRDATGITQTATPVGIGDVFLIAGQSNAVGELSALNSYTNGAGLKATVFPWLAAAWQDGNDPYFSTNIFGSPWPLFATWHMQAEGVPCGFVQTAVGGKSLANGITSPWYFTRFRPDTGAAGTGWGILATAVTAAGINSFAACLWYQGENDADNNVPAEAYGAAFVTFCDNVAAVAPGAPKTIPMLIGGDSLNQFDPEISLGIIAAANLGGNVLVPVSIWDVSNDLHILTAPQGHAAANRFWAAYTGVRGPRVTSCQYNSARTAVTVTFDQVLKTGLTFGTGAWAVTGNGTPATVSAVAYNGTDTRAVDLTLSAAAALPILVSYCDLTNPATFVVPLGPNVTMPDGSTVINLPAEPFRAKTAALAGASPPPPPPPPGGTAGARIFEGF